MKPAHLALVGASLVLGLGLWSGRESSTTAYKAPLATNEFPSRFTDPIQLPIARPTPEPTPMITAPKIPSLPPLSEPWQATAINDGIRWMLTEGFKQYSRVPFAGTVYLRPDGLPSGFTPSVSGFKFAAEPHTPFGRTMNPNEVRICLLLTRPPKPIEPASNSLAKAYGELQVAEFGLALVGNVGVRTVDLYGGFGVFKGTNGYFTRMLYSFDP